MGVVGWIRGLSWAGALFALALPAATALPAHAAWSTPQTLSAAPGFSNLRSGASGPEGTLLKLGWNPPSHYGALPNERVLAATASRGAPFGAPRALPASYATGPMVSLGGGRLAQLIFVPAGPNGYRARVALGSVSGRFGAPRTVPGALVFAQRASLAGNARGELIFTWISATAHGEHRVVWASWAKRDARFCAPHAISRASQAEHVTAAVGARGDAVVAFPDKYGHMLARVRRPTGRWEALQRIGLAAGGNENDVAPYVGADGRVIVAWYETQLCEGGCQGPGFVRVALQPAGRARFHPEQVLERDPFGLAGAPMGLSLAPVVVAAGRSSPVVAFLGAGAPPQPPMPSRPAAVEVSRLQGDRFGRATAISPAGETAGGVAAAADGSRVLVTWVRADPLAYIDGTVFAAVASAPGYSFGPPEQVSPSERASGALPLSTPAPAAGTNGPWTVAWTSRPPDGSSSVVRVASGQPGA